MDWVKPFYERQHQLANVYSGDVESYHRDKAASIVLPDREPPYRIVELGCGGGQVAAALGDLGHTVVAIDLSPSAIINARRLAESRPDSRLTLVEGDFYDFDPDAPFDAVCYFDGFGIGTDADQHNLLRQVCGWLTDGGRAFIEVYTPWYWRRAAGTTMEWPGAAKQYGFDETSCRMLDTWWPADHRDDAVTQSLRCYSPDDLESLLDQIDLDIVEIQPGAAYDTETRTLRANVPLTEAMQYLAILEQRPSVS